MKSIPQKSHYLVVESIDGCLNPVLLGQLDQDEEYGIQLFSTPELARAQLRDIANMPHTNFDGELTVAQLTYVSVCLVEDLLP